MLVDLSLRQPSVASIATILPPFNKPPSYFQFCLKFRRMRSETPPICWKLLGLCRLGLIRKIGGLGIHDSLQLRRKFARMARVTEPRPCGRSGARRDGNPLNIFLQEIVEPLGEHGEIVHEA